MRKLLKRDGDEFIKYHGPSIKADWRQVTTLERLTRDVPGIRTARPLRLDHHTECIVYEWFGDLPRMITLHEDALDDMVCKLGRTLADVHEVSAAMPVVDHDADSPAELPLDRLGIDKESARKIHACLPVAFFHGDCWHGNVLVDADRNCVLIDPIQSPWLFGKRRFERANGIVDLATLHMSLLVSHRIMPLSTLDIGKQLAVGDLLLESYLTRFDATSLRRHVLDLSLFIATKYVSSYPTRINTLVGWVKLWLSNKVIARAKELV